MKAKQLVGIVAAAIIIVLVGILGINTAAQLQTGTRSLLGGLFSSDVSVSAEPTDPSIAIVRITGEIGSTTYNIFGQPTSSYVHSRIISLIYEMAASETNRGLMLYIDSPGGTVLASDEVYLALQYYKNQTGRPIYAYSNQIMASGAYYIACAAEHIVVNRNAEVGSIGVYIRVTNYAGMYEQMGIDTEYIRSGPNKAMGNDSEPLTEEQRAIYQGIVDECYEQFLYIVCESRGYTRDQLLPIADGRIYTARLALENGLIDEIGTRTATLNSLMQAANVTTVYDRVYTTSGVASLLGMLAEALPKSETEYALEYAENNESGVPMYHA